MMTMTTMTANDANGDDDGDDDENSGSVSSDAAVLRCMSSVQVPRFRLTRRPVTVSGSPNSDVRLQWPRRLRLAKGSVWIQLQSRRLRRRLVSMQRRI